MSDAFKCSEFDESHSQSANAVVIHLTFFVYHYHYSLSLLLLLWFYLFNKWFLNVCQQHVNRLSTWIGFDSIPFDSSVSILLNWISFKCCQHFSNARRPTSESMNFGLCLAERLSDCIQWILSTTHPLYGNRTKKKSKKKMMAMWMTRMKVL